MALIPIRVDRTSKPPLGTPLRTDGHWSVQGLTGFWSLPDSIISALTSEIGTLNNGSYLSSKGAHFGDGSSQSIYLAARNTNFEPADKAITLLAGGVTISSITTNLAGYGGYKQVNGTVKYGFISATTPGLWATLGGNVVHRLPITYNVPTTLGISYNGVNWVAYKDGAISQAGTGTYSIAGVGNEKMMLGNDAVTSYPSAIKWLASYKRTLSPTEVASLSANPWQIYEPETVWIDIGGSTGGTVFSGAFAASTQMASSFSGQLGVGGGISAAAGSATYATAGAEGKQGQAAFSLSDMINSISGNAGVSGGISVSLAEIINALSGNAGVLGALSSVQGATVPSLSGQMGVSGEIAGSMSLAAYFSEGVLFSGSISAAIAALTPAISGNAGITGQALATISIASVISGALGNNSILAATLANVAQSLAGQTGASGAVAMSISSGLEMAAKLGVSGSILTGLIDLDAHLIEVVIGGKIARIVLSTRTGQAVILTATGHITITTN